MSRGRRFYFILTIQCEWKATRGKHEIKEQNFLFQCVSYLFYDYYELFFLLFISARWMNWMEKVGKKPKKKNTNMEFGLVILSVIFVSFNFFFGAHFLCLYLCVCVWCNRWNKIQTEIECLGPNMKSNSDSISCKHRCYLRTTSYSYSNSNKRYTRKHAE